MTSCPQPRPPSPVGPQPPWPPAPPPSPVAPPPAPPPIPVGLSQCLGSLCSEGAGSFPGSDILALVTQVGLHLRGSVDEVLQRDR